MIAPRAWLRRQSGTLRRRSTRARGHTENDAARVVLSDGYGAGGLHSLYALSLYALCAVRAHAREDGADRMSPGRLGDRAEQHIDRRPLIADHRAILHGHPVDPARLAQNH